MEMETPLTPEAAEALAAYDAARRERIVAAGWARKARGGRKAYERFREAVKAEDAARREWCRVVAERAGPAPRPKGALTWCEMTPDERTRAFAEGEPAALEAVQAEWDADDAVARGGR